MNKRLDDSMILGIILIGIIYLLMSFYEINVKSGNTLLEVIFLTILLLIMILLIIFIIWDIMSVAKNNNMKKWFSIVILLFSIYSTGQLLYLIFLSLK